MAGDSLSSPQGPVASVSGPGCTGHGAKLQQPPTLTAAAVEYKMEDVWMV